VTTLATVAAGAAATATFVAKADGVLAGAWVAHAVFARVDPAVRLEWRVGDGARVAPGQVLAVAVGPARAILVAERVALNFLQRMSGIATLTAAMVAAAAAGGGTATVLDTRKTAPGLRVLDKWAVAIGGGANHRMGLFDMAMIKDNHIAAAGGIEAAILAAGAHMAAAGVRLPLEVEARTLDELREVLAVLEARPACGVTRIMLDNMTRRGPSGELDVSLLREAVALVGGRAVETEASGNVGLATVGAIAATGVHFVSCGALTHSIAALDISMLIET
jgi:nicotinate-nucleotide pyrophosphorylase (carboxylating)